MKEKNVGDNYPLSDNAIAVLNRRYFLKNDKGEVFEDWINLCLRVSNHIAADEKTVALKQEWAKKYYELIHDLFFIPNTPTLMNAGKPNGQLAACFVLPVQDDMTQIMQTATHAALIHKSGGGTGFSFGNLRPKNSRVKTTSGVASGPVTFMKMYNDITECIKQGGTRRGANMGILPCLSGKTKVNTINGKIPIAELENKDAYVYAYDISNKKIAIKKASFYKNGINKAVYAVKLDNDDIVYATDNHRFLLSDGTYKEVKDLQVNDSLMALYKTSYNQYTQVGGTGDTYTKPEHILVGEMLIGRELKTMTNNGKRGPLDECVHHIDGNTFNNDPLNIQVLTISEHAKIHKETLVANQKRIALARKGRKLSDIYPEDVVLKWKANMKKSAQSRKNKVWNADLPTDSYKEHYKNGFKNQYSNHRVKEIYFIGNEDVYDATVPDFHNFAVENVFVHNCSHPDILDFIDCKQDVTQITNFNISVGITDDFMKALKANEEYDLIDPHTKAVVGKLKAKTVFDKIVKNAWQTGEPGIFFIDNANATNKYGHIEATNPCGEQPLRANEACTLGSLNISNYVFNSEFDWDLLEEHIVAATRFLDSVVSVNHYPIDIIEKTHKETRKIGLGVMGFADALIDMGIIYGSDASIKFGEELFEFINSRSKLASIELGKEKGICKACLDLNLPYRNYWTTTVAPTGTISIIANCSSGIEPIFAVAYERNVMDKTRLVEFNAIFKGMMEELDIEISAELSDKIAHSDSIQKIKEIPEHIRRVFVTASDVTPEQHVKMQAAFQKHCDSGVSKTINLPSTATIEDVKTAYLLAYELKCKGITVYRDGSRPEQVLSTKKADKKEKAIWKRPSLVPGFTEKVDSSLGRLYITTNYKEDGSPVEVFLHIGSSGADINALFEGIGKLISLSLQNDIPANKVGKRLKGIQGEEKVIADNKKYASLLDLIGKRLESAYKEKLEEDKEEQSLMMCPECEVRVYRAENCYKCMSCGWSKC